MATILMVVFFIMLFVAACGFGLLSASKIIFCPTAPRKRVSISPAVIRHVRRKESHHTVLAGEYARDLAAANVAARKLRELGIGVERVVIRNNDQRPLLMLRVDAGRSISPLLDATKGKHYWIPACKDTPARGVAAFCDCTLKWEMPSPAKEACA
ncbi:MAG: hypothetical protein LBE22_07670 [Azoarcus sp.]|jgi:hypothetical protein|nr:hypothetical protein [Azoarcus sp.]